MSTKNSEGFNIGDYISISNYMVMKIDNFKYVSGDDAGTCYFTGTVVGYLCGDKIYRANNTIDVPALRLDRMVRKISKDEFKRTAERYIISGGLDIDVNDLL